MLKFCYDAENDLLSCYSKENCENLVFIPVTYDFSGNQPKEREINPEKLKNTIMKYITSEISSVRN